MQRVLCMRGNGSDATVVALRVARRWLRKRPSLPMSPLAASAAAPPPPPPSSSPVHDERTATATAATRAGETPSHTSSTLERIRAEVRAMHREAQAAAAARRAASEQQQQQQRQEQQADTTAATHHDGRSRDDALDAALRDALRRRHKPSSAYYVGDDVRASVAAARQLSQRTLEQEAAEVLRRVSRDDVQHYLRLAFPQRSHTAAAAAAATSSHGSHSNNDDGNSRASSVAAVARALEARVQAAKAAVRARNNNDNNDAACARLSERDVATLAWLEVLEAMSDAQLRQLRDCGLLNANAIEELCAPSTEAAELHTRVTTAATTHEQQQQQQPRVARDSVDDSDDGDINGDDDDTLALDATLRAVQSLQHLGELTRDVCETMLRRAPSPDVAPAMQKVRNRQHDDVTARELQMLEAYEETTLPLRVRHTSNNSNSNNNDNDNDAATTATTHMTTLHVTPSLLDRALLPSNWLLDAVAQHDATLRRGLDHLERIKRATLLDADFQDALRVAHALEAPLLASVRAQVGLAPPQQQQQSSPRRLHMTTTTTTTTATVRASPVRPYHAADLPYFMHSPRSIVPPHAHFNLPAPALSAHERAIARGRRRRAQGRRRFAK